MDMSATRRLLNMLSDAYTSLTTESFVSSSACDTLVQTLLQSFFIRPGSVFTLGDCPSTLAKNAVFFFGPEGPFIKAVYQRSMRYHTTYKVPLKTVSELYVQLAEINPIMLPHYYYYKMKRSSDGDLVLNLLEYTITMICSSAIHCRVSSKEGNITYKVRLTPYNRLILSYLQVLRKKGSILCKPLSMEEIQRADDASMQPSCTISQSPFASASFPRSVGDLFVSLAADCWFARNIPIGTAEQLSVPFEVLKETCQIKEVPADASKEEKDLHARALNSTHYRTVAYDCTDRSIVDRPCFLTNILDLAYMFARYVVSPAAALDYGALDTLSYLGESTRRNLVNQWSDGSPPTQHFDPALSAGGKRFIHLAEDFHGKEIASLYLVRNGSSSIMGYFVNKGQISGRGEDSGQNFSLRHSTPPYSEIIETRVLPTFYSFLRTLMQSEPVINKVYLYLLMSRIYGEALCLDPSRLMYDTELYLDDRVFSFKCSAEDGDRIRAAIAIRAPFYTTLPVEWTQHVTSTHIGLISNPLQMLSKGTRNYGTLPSLFNVRSFYCHNYCKGIQHLAALNVVNHWLSHPIVESSLAALGAMASKVAPVDLEMDALLFTARARALLVYTMCEPVLWHKSSERSNAVTTATRKYANSHSMALQPNSLDTAKCLLDTELFSRSVPEASQALLEDCKHLSLWGHRHHTEKSSAHQHQHQYQYQRNQCYMLLDSKAAPLDNRTHKAYPTLTGYVGLINTALARSGEEHLPHPEDKLFYREYMTQFTKYTSQVKALMSRLNHTNNITMNKALTLQFNVFPLERLLLRVAGWHPTRLALNEMCSISSLYNMIHTDSTRSFTRIMSTDGMRKDAASRRRIKRGPVDRPMDIIASPEYQQLRELGSGPSTLRYAAYCVSNSATKILKNSGLVEDVTGDLSYSMLSASRESMGHTAAVVQPVRPDEFATLVIALDILASACNYVLSVLGHIVYYFYKSPGLKRRLDNNFSITFRILANKKLWCLVSAILVVGWLLRLVLL